MSERKTIGIFGGTFDPVHIGHLRVALELKEHLELDEMRLLPAHKPPHRAAPCTGGADRAAMVRLAVEKCPQLAVDERELRRESPSYTVDTLLEMRGELGPEVSLGLAIGMDSLASFHTWHRWWEILDLAHLLVAARPGWQLPTTGPVAEQLRLRRASAPDLRRYCAGKILVQELVLLPISSTEIRHQIEMGRSAQFLLPDVVWSYICEHRLYR